jgi:ABC-type dipeptide/oligopeptide/nickel transport system permease subunit
MHGRKPDAPIESARLGGRVVRALKRGGRRRRVPRVESHQRRRRIGLGHDGASGRDCRFRRAIDRRSILWGALAGYAGGRTDALMMRTVDVLYGLPSILLVVLLSVAAEGIAARLGGGSLPQGAGILVLFVAIGGTSWLTMSRVIRGQVLSLRAQPFMEACRATGVPAHRQFMRHLLPNLVGPMVVYATLAVPAAILSESFLSFLGIGVREPVPSWGSLASSGLSEVNLVVSRWWLLAAPCAMIAATLVSLNFIGDSLRARYDPTASRARW